MGDFVPYAGEVKPIAAGFTPYTGEVKPAPMSWGDVGHDALNNVGRSAKQAGEAIIAPVVHPVDTAKTFGDLALGIYSKLSNPNPTLRNEVYGKAAPTPEETAEKAKKEASVDKMAEFYKHRYGSLEGFKKALAEDPIGVAMDIGTLGTAGAGLPGKIGSVAKIGKAVDPVGLVSGAATKGAKAVETVGAETLGHLTGGGPDAIRQAVKAGYQGETEFLDSLFNKVPLEDSVKVASQGVANMRKVRGEQYETLKKTISKDHTVLDFTKIQDARKAVDDVGSFEGIPLYSKSADVRHEVGGILDAWSKLPKDKFHTVDGFDALKKKLGDVLDSIPYDQRPARKYVGDIKRAVSTEITKQAPDYAKMMKDYHQASEGLEEIERALSLGEKSTYDAGIRKLLQAMRNNANTNYGNRLKMVDALEASGSKGLKSTLAGAQMSSGFPRGMAGRNPALTLLGGLHQPWLIGALPFESPRFVGKNLYRAGAGARGLKDILDSTILPDASVRKNLPTAPDAVRILNQVGRQDQIQGAP